MTVAALVMTHTRRSSRRPAFTDVASAHLGAVHRYLTQMVRDAHVAEDLTSETFERAFRNWHRFDPGKATALTWLIAIARNVAHDHLRADKRRRAREERAASDPRVDELPETGGLSPAMRAALAGLSDVEREVVALRVLLDIDGPTTAQMIGATPTAVSTHLHRAMTKLRKELGT